MIQIRHDINTYISESHAQNQSHETDDIKRTLDTIEAAVKLEGDVAVIAYTKRFDNVTSDTFTLRVTREEIDEAYTLIDPQLIIALKVAKENIETYHKNQAPKNWENSPRDGVCYGVQFSPLECVGLYVPGGRAPYPSTVLMDTIPAKLAGVTQLIMTTPPQKNGKIPAQILVAADLCGVDIIIKAGGSQAIFGLAYGTQSIPKVDKIVGPGNIYVDLAKQRVYGKVDIDKPAGPSDVTVYIDSEKYAAYAASELLAQLEHDPKSIAIAISKSNSVLKSIQTECNTQILTLSRKDIILEAAKNSALLLIDENSNEADAINHSAPEHLVILTDDPDTLRKKIKHAGSIFCGPYTPVTLGDYYAGPNHVLPTSGAARFASPLGMMDFVKYSSYMTYSQAALKEASNDLKQLTEMEGFDAHYNAVHQRIK
jgi:histidinol dehydrogenase